MAAYFQPVIFHLWSSQFSYRWSYLPVCFPANQVALRLEVAVFLACLYQRTIHLYSGIYYRWCISRQTSSGLSVETLVVPTPTKLESPRLTAFYQHLNYFLLIQHEGSSLLFIAPVQSVYLAESSVLELCASFLSLQQTLTTFSKTGSNCSYILQSFHQLYWKCFMNNRPDCFIQRTITK